MAWNNSYNGGDSALGDGGFMPEGSTPGGTGGDQKRQRVNNIVPMYLSDILECNEDTIKVEGQEVGMVVIVGQIRSITAASTKVTYLIEDKSGQEIECTQFIEDDKNQGNSDISENMYCRVVGSIKSNQGKKYIVIIRILPVTQMTEVDAHQLEVLHARLKIKQRLNKENASIFGNKTDSGLANSMMGSSVNASSSNSFGNNKHDLVFKMISGCDREEGINKDELMDMLKGKMSKDDLEVSLEFLSSEGHVYSTINDNTFKTIDS